MRPSLVRAGLRSAIVCAAVLLGAFAAQADEFSGWHDSQSLDFGRDATIESSSSSTQSSDGAQVNETRTSAVDGEGNRVDSMTRETTRADGTSTVEQDVSHTDPYGRQTRETSNQQYDADGNLTGETRSDGTSEAEPAPPDAGLEIDYSRSDGTGSEVVYGADSMSSTIQPGGTKVVHDLTTGRSNVIMPGTKSYMPSTIDFCEQMNDALVSQYGSQKAYLQQAMSPQMIEQIRSSAQMMPSHTPEMRAAKEQMLASAAQMERSARQLETFEPLDPRKLVFEFTGQRKLIAGHIAERVTATQDGKLVNESWLAETVNRRGVFNNARLQKGAVDKLLSSPAREHSDPKVRRAFSRAVLESTSYSSFGATTSTATRLRRVKLSADRFRVPEGYTESPAADPRAAAQVLPAAS